MAAGRAKEDTLRAIPQHHVSYDFQKLRCRFAFVNVNINISKIFWDGSGEKNYRYVRLNSFHLYSQVDASAALQHVIGYGATDRCFAERIQCVSTIGDTNYPVTVLFQDFPSQMQINLVILDEEDNRFAEGKLIYFSVLVFIDRLRQVTLISISETAKRRYLK